MSSTPAFFMNALEPGTELHWYRIRQVIGQGAFGITYLADDTNLDREVAIKEFLPAQFAVRDESASVEPISSEQADSYERGLEGFITEARTLARFEHPNIVRVHNVFEANNTAYMVMRYEQGDSLHTVLRERGTLPESELPALIFPLLSGLEAVHAMGFIHRDVKPANVFIRADGSPVLLDFGSARESLDDQTRTLTNFVSPGYAPIEQYTGKSNSQGPWTDIYGLSATLYRAISGTMPMNAVERGQEIAQEGRDGLEAAADVAPDYNPALLAAIDHGLAFRATDRPASISAWRPQFDAVFGPQTTPLTAPATQATPTARVRATPGPREPRSRRRSAPAMAAGTLVLVLVVVLAWWLRGSPAPEVADSTVSAAHDPGSAATATPDPVVSTPAAVPQTSDESRVDEPVPDAVTAAAEPVLDPVTELLNAAAADLAALRLTTPADANAHDKYQTVLAMDPDNERARRGLEAIAVRYLELTYRAIAKDAIEQASTYLGKAVSISPGVAGLDDARDAVAAAQDPGSGDTGDYDARAEAMGAAFGTFVEEQQPQTETRSRGDAFLDRFGN